MWRYVITNINSAAFHEKGRELYQTADEDLADIAESFEGVDTLLLLGKGDYSDDMIVEVDVGWRTIAEQIYVYGDYIPRDEENYIANTVQQADPRGLSPEKRWAVAFDSPTILSESALEELAEKAALQSAENRRTAGKAMPFDGHLGKVSNLQAAIGGELRVEPFAA